jgi:hypothetical protein
VTISQRAARAIPNIGFFGLNAAGPADFCQLPRYSMKNNDLNAVRMETICRAGRLSAMDRKQLVSRVLAKANKYRGYAHWIGDSETAQRIVELAAKLKLRAGVLATPSEKRIRRRAREIWEENGRPAGRDWEFWFQAEREFREAEELANRGSDKL